MNFEDLDKDTQGIIDAMCKQTGETREKSILALVEFGMVSMIAAIESNSIFNNRQKKIMKIVFSAINSNEKMRKTADIYRNVWSLDI